MLTPYDGSSHFRESNLQPYCTRTHLADSYCVECGRAERTVVHPTAAQSNLISRHPQHGWHHQQHGWQHQHYQRDAGRDLRRYDPPPPVFYSQRRAHSPSYERRIAYNERPAPRSPPRYWEESVHAEFSPRSLRVPPQPLYDDRRPHYRQPPPPMVRYAPRAQCETCPTCASVVDVVEGDRSYRRERRQRLVRADTSADPHLFSPSDYSASSDDEIVVTVDTNRPVRIHDRY
jgi:hypothetical protein